jgi:hypothetical protein
MEFFQLFSERRWQELNHIREFDGGLNAALIFALFCNRGGCMLAVRDPVELYDSMELLDTAVLDEEEFEKVRTLSVELHGF